jgi:5-formyltetrahydrofolate cyclo-ligase
MTHPADLRKQILTARNKLDPAQRHKKSSQILERLLPLDEIQASRNIFIYVNFRSEVETVGIIDELLAQGKNVSVPLTRIEEKRLEIVSISDPDKELVPGYCDIPEPREELVRTNSVNPEQLDVIVLPGSVFDLRGGRFGYGGGYYDRLLASIPRARRVALAFELQIVDKLPLQNHDEILDTIVTEQRLISSLSRTP